MSLRVFLPLLLAVEQQKKAGETPARVAMKRQGVPVSAVLSLRNRPLPRAVTEQCLQFLAVTDFPPLICAGRDGRALFESAMINLRRAVLISVPTIIPTHEAHPRLRWALSAIHRHCRRLTSIDLGTVEAPGVTGRHLQVFPTDIEAALNNAIAANSESLTRIDPAVTASAPSTVAALTRCPLATQLWADLGSDRDMDYLLAEFDAVQAHILKALAGITLAVRGCPNVTDFRLSKIDGLSHRSKLLIDVLSSDWRLKSLGLATPVAVEVVRALEHQSGLTSLELFVEKWPECMIAVGEILPKLSLLESLTLAECSPPDHDDTELHESHLSDALWILPSLTSLTINWANSGRLILPTIIAPRLVTFNGSIRAVTAAAMLTNCPSLTDVDFSFWALDEDQPQPETDKERKEHQALIDSFKIGGKRLQRFHCNCYLDMHAVSLPLILALVTTAGPTLRNVHMDEIPDDMTAMELFGRHCPQLEELHLHRILNLRRLAGISEINSTVILPALRTLHLTQMTDDRVRMILAPGVTKLHVSWRSGDASVIFQSFPALRELVFQCGLSVNFGRIAMVAPILSDPRGVHVHDLAITSTAESLSMIARCPNIQSLHLQNNIRVGYDHRTAPAFCRAVAGIPSLTKVTNLTCDWVLENATAAMMTMVAAMPALKSVHFPLYKGTRNSADRKRLADTLGVALIASGFKVTGLDP